MKIIKLMDDVYVNAEYIVSIDAYGLYPTTYKSRVFTAYKYDKSNNHYYSIYTPDELVKIMTEIGL